jgi:hypothetical protein
LRKEAAAAETLRKEAAAAETLRKEAAAAETLRKEAAAAAQVEESRVNRLLVEHSEEKNRLYQLQRHCQQRLFQRQWVLYCNFMSFKRYMGELVMYNQGCMRQMRLNYAAQCNKMQLVQAQVLSQRAAEKAAQVEERCKLYDNAGCDRTYQMLHKVFRMYDVQLSCPRKCYPRKWPDKCFDCRKNQSYCDIIQAEDIEVGERIAAQNRECLAECLNCLLRPLGSIRGPRLWGWAFTFRLNGDGVLQRSRFKIEFKPRRGREGFEPLYISSTTPVVGAPAIENTLSAPWIFPGDFVDPDTVICRSRSEAVLSGNANSDDKLLQLDLIWDSRFDFGNGGYQLFVGNFSNELTVDVRTKCSGGHTRLMVYQKRCIEKRKAKDEVKKEFARRRQVLNFPENRPLHNTVVVKDVASKEPRDSMSRCNQDSVAIKEFYDWKERDRRCAVYDGTELLLTTTFTPRIDLTDLVGQDETELHVLLRSVVFFADPQEDRELPPIPAMQYKFEDKTRLVRAQNMPMAGRYCRLREQYTTYRPGRRYHFDLENHLREPTEYPAPASYYELENRAYERLRAELEVIESQKAAARAVAKRSYDYDALLNSEASDDSELDVEDEADARVWGRKTRPKAKKTTAISGPEADARNAANLAWMIDKKLQRQYYPTDSIYSGNHQTFDCVNYLKVGEEGRQHVEQGVYLISRHTNRWNKGMNEEGFNRLTVWEYDPSEGTRGAMSIVFSAMDNMHHLRTCVQDLRGVTNLRVTYPNGTRRHNDSHEFLNYDEPTIFQLRKGPACGAHCRVFPFCHTCVRTVETFGEVTRLYSDLDSFGDRHYLFEFPRNDSDLEMFNRNTLSDVGRSDFFQNINNDAEKLVIATEKANKWYRVHKKAYYRAVSESDDVRFVLEQHNQQRLKHKLSLRNDEPSNLCNVELEVMSDLFEGGEKIPLRFTEASHIDENPPRYTEAVYTIGNSEVEDLEGPLCRITFCDESVAPRHCTISVDKQRRVWLKVDFDLTSNHTVVIYKKHVLVEVMTSGRIELKNGYTVSLGKSLISAYNIVPLPVVLKVKFNR